MLHDQKILEIAKEIAESQLPGAGLEGVATESATDSEGGEALRITVILKPGIADALSGDLVLDLLVELQRALEEAGEERLPIIDFATKGDLQNDRDEAGIDDDDSAEDEA